MTDQDDQLSSSLEQKYNPKCPTELNFTTWAEKYTQLEKNQFENEDEKESRLFWIKTTRDFTKLSQTQHYFQYLSYAQLRPKLHFLIRARFFETWRKGVYYSKWNRLAKGLRRNQLLEEMHEAAEKIKYVRTKIACQTFSADVDTTKTKESIDKLTENLTNPTQTLNNLSPKPIIPIKEQSPRASQSKIASPKRSPKSKSRKSESQSPKTREMDIQEEQNEPNEENQQPETNENESQNESKKPNFLIYLIPIVSLFLGVLMFYVVTPSYVYNSAQKANNNIFQTQQEPVQAKQAEILDDNINKTSTNENKISENNAQTIDDKNNTIVQDNQTTSNEQPIAHNEEQLNKEQQHEEQTKREMQHEEILKKKQNEKAQ